MMRFMSSTKPQRGSEQHAGQPVQETKKILHFKRLDDTKLCIFDIPENVRQQIFRDAVVVKKVFVKPFTSAGYLEDPDFAKTHEKPNMALLQVSRQVYDEVMPIYCGENVFSIVHPDVLIDLSAEFPRVCENLSLIRKVELVLDGRDFGNVSKNFAKKLLDVVTTLRNLPNKPNGTDENIDAIIKLRRRLLATDIIPKNRNMMTDDDKKALHKRCLENIEEFLWGRTLTFARQAFKLDEIHLHFENCYCYIGCCRLADKVMGWGEGEAWVFQPPRRVFIGGANKEEREAIMATLMSQRPGEGVSMEVEGTTGGEKYEAYLVMRGVLRGALKALQGAE